MNVNELSVANVVGELVKNSIDAQCNVVQVEFNGTFDIRVIDDGCGFDEHAIQDIGERQVFLTHALSTNQFRYGQYGKFLMTIAQGTAEIFIESIKHNSDVRLYKTIVASESYYKVYETNRNYKNAFVKTGHGSMIVLNTLKLNVSDTNQFKASIVNSVVELGLINFGIDVSVKDTATQQTLYESYRTKNLFDKFEQFLESQRFFSKIQSVSCEKHEVKVELFLCEDGTANKAFQFVYFNKSSEQDGNWGKIVNKLCKKRFEKDLNTKRPVYLLNICVGNYLENQLANNSIIDNCIRKCVEQLSQSTTVKATISQKPVSKAKVPEANEDKGVRLGDWIFNNSCEDYKQLNLGREVYRKKICENWVISLEKPKPKDVDDSLNSVVINRSSPDDHLFKKPRPMKQMKRKIQKIGPKSAPYNMREVSTQIETYKPSQRVKAFNNSSLIRASKELILKTSTDKKRKISTNNRVISPLKMQRSALQHHHKRSSENNVNVQSSHRMDTQENDASLEYLNDQNDGFNRKLSEALKSPVHATSRRETVDFRCHKQTKNFNLNFTSSIAIRTINDDDPFMHFLRNDDVNNSMANLFGPPGTHFGASVYSETSELHLQDNRNDTIHTHYRHRTYRNFISDNSLSANKSGVNSGQVNNENSRPAASIPNSLHSGTSVVPKPKQNLSFGSLSDNVRPQSGWPVTININFGQQK